MNDMSCRVRLVKAGSWRLIAGDGRSSGSAHVRHARPPSDDHDPSFLYPELEDFGEGFLFTKEGVSQWPSKRSSGLWYWINVAYLEGLGHLALPLTYVQPRVTLRYLLPSQCLLSGRTTTQEVFK